jgi:hypothetical protein
VPVEGDPVGGGEHYAGEPVAEGRRDHAVGDHCGHVPVLDQRRRGKPGALQIRAGLGADERQPLAGPPGSIHCRGQVEVGPAVCQDGGAVGQQGRRVLAERGATGTVGVGMRGGLPGYDGDEFVPGEGTVIQRGEYRVHGVADVVVGGARGD